MYTICATILIIGSILRSYQVTGLSYGKPASIEEDQQIDDCPELDCYYLSYPMKCFKPTTFWYEGRLCPGCFRNICSTYLYNPPQYMRRNYRPTQYRQKNFYYYDD